MELDMRREAPGIPAVREAVSPKRKKGFQGNHSLRLLAGFLILAAVCTVLSYAADSVTVAQVQTKTAGSGTLDQSLKIEGTFQADSSQTVSAPSGLVVEEVKVKNGDSVKQGDPLILFRKEEADSAIRSLQSEIRTLQAEHASGAVQDQFHLQDLQAAVTRAQQDLDNAREDARLQKEKAEKALTDAQNAVSKAEKELEEVQGKSLEEHIKSLREKNETAQSAYEAAQKAFQDAGTEGDRMIQDAQDALQKAQHAYKEGNYGIDEVNTHLEAVKQAQKQLTRAEEDRKTNVDRAREAMDRAEMKALEAEADLLQAEQAQGTGELPDVEAARNALEATRKDVEAKKEAIIETELQSQSPIRSAERALQSAQNALQQSSPNQALNAAKREEQAVLLEEKQKKLRELSQMAEAGYLLTAPADGTVDQCAAEPGKSTDGGTLATLSTWEQGWKFEGTLPKKDAERLTAGAKAYVVWKGPGGEQGQETVIEDVSAPDEKGLVTVKARLQNIICREGQSAALEYKASSERYSCLLPLSALRKDKSGDFILIAVSSVGAFGKSYIAERVAVQILDQDANMAAVTATLDSSSPVIISSSRNLSPGDRVRILP